MQLAPSAAAALARSGQIAAGPGDRQVAGCQWGRFVSSVLASSLADSQAVPDAAGACRALCNNRAWLLVESVGWSEQRDPGLLGGLTECLLGGLPALGHGPAQVPARCAEHGLLEAARGGQH